MRIENAINEVRGPNALDRRDTEVKRRRQAAKSGDVVEISNAARKLGSQAIRRADLDAVSDVRQARVEEVRQRVADGYYDRPEVRQAIADAVLDSGVVEGVATEAKGGWRISGRGFAECAGQAPCHRHCPAKRWTDLEKGETCTTCLRPACRGCSRSVAPCSW